MPEYKWSGQDVKDCTRYGVLWRVKRLKLMKVIGDIRCYRVHLKRLRRKGAYMYEDGKLKNVVWNIRTELNEGDMVFRDHDGQAYTRIQPGE